MITTQPDRWDEVFDVVVMGSGAAGLSAATLASDAGAEVLLLERAPIFGGTSGVSGGIIWAPCNRWGAEAGIEEAPGERVAVGGCDAAQLKVSAAGDFDDTIAPLAGRGGERARLGGIERSQRDLDPADAAVARRRQPIKAGTGGLADGGRLVHCGNLDGFTVG